MAPPPLSRRVYGIESEYGICFTLRGQNRLSPDEISRYLFRLIVTWGKSSNIFLENGARLYIDVGSHPEYATPECDSVAQLVTHDKAGDRILEGLVATAEKRLQDDGVAGKIHVFKNNTDNHENSYGCHENYLIPRFGKFAKVVEILVPFLVTRQIFLGAGQLMVSPTGAARFVISQRADHIWESMSSATTRSRPLINTRDEPHADAEKYRRLHIISSDTNMSEFANWIKVGTVSVLLSMIEADYQFRDMTLKNPIRSLREISEDLTCQTKVELANDRILNPVEIQWEYCERALDFISRNHIDPELARVTQCWAEMLTTIEDDPMRLHRQVDWVSKYRMIETYRHQRGLALSDPRVRRLDLSYHDINRKRGLYNLAVSAGLMDRISSEKEITQATHQPPPRTRAALRGRFVKAASDQNRDVLVDWVHLKVNDSHQRTVTCKDPLVYEDERVDRIIASFGNLRSPRSTRSRIAGLASVPTSLPVGDSPGRSRALLVPDAEPLAFSAGPPQRSSS